MILVLNFTQQAAATLLGVTPRTLRDWETAGKGVPRNGDGMYPGPELVAWYYSHKSGNDYDDQRERLNAAQAEKVETENAVRRGELAQVSDVIRFVSDHIVAARAKILGAAAKLSPQLVGINDPNIIAARIRAEMHAALAELAEWEPTVGSEAGAEGNQALETAARFDSEPVGGQEPATQ